MSHALKPLDITKANRTLGAIDLARLTGTNAVVRPISGFERFLRPSRPIVGIEPSPLSGALLGLSSERRSILFTGFEADRTSQMVKRYLGQEKLFAETASRSLAGMTAAHLRADVATTLAGALGIKSKELRGVREMLTGGATKSLTSEKLRPFAEHPLFGSNAQRNLSRWIEGLRPTLNRIAESAMWFVDLRQDLDERAVAFVARHGWPLPLVLPLTVLHRVVGLVDRPKREVTATMLDAFGPKSKAFGEFRDVLTDSAPGLHP